MRKLTPQERRRRKKAPEHFALSHRTQREWIKLLHEITDIRIRMKVAAIVWWDWYGESRRTASMLRKEFRNLRDEDSFHADIEEDIHRELLRLGYRPFIARIRSKVPLREEDKKRKEYVCQQTSNHSLQNLQ